MQGGFVFPKGGTGFDPDPVSLGEKRRAFPPKNSIT